MDVQPPDPAVPPQRATGLTTSRLVVPDRTTLEQALAQLRQDGWLLLGVAVVEAEEGLRWRVHAERPVGEAEQAGPDGPAAQASSAAAASTTSPGGTRRL